MNNKAVTIGILALGFVFAGLIFLIEPQGSTSSHDEGAETDEFERGPHNGRLLRDGDIALEITIFEDNVPPEFHIYPYKDGKPLKPSTVGLVVELGRLGGVVDRITFVPENDYLKGQQTVVEPHSFDVKVAARIDNKAHNWSYQSYEGRVDISAEAAVAGGLKTEVAGPAIIRQLAIVTGTIIVDPARSAKLKARFPGVVRELRKSLGDQVTRGEVVAIVESNDSLQGYQIRSPIDGTVIAQYANVGETVSDLSIIDVADLTHVVAELHVFPRDAASVKPQQTVVVKALDTDATAEGTVSVVLAHTLEGSQAIPARVTIPNPDLAWKPGMLVEASITTGATEAPLAVRNDGLQAFRDFRVVFAKVGNTYEVRMLELGATDGEFTEVLGGLTPGTTYVSENSFLIKADIEKTGASHDH